MRSTVGSIPPKWDGESRDKLVKFGETKGTSGKEDSRSDVQVQFDEGMTKASATDASADVHKRAKTKRKRAEEAAEAAHMPIANKTLKKTAHIPIANGKPAAKPTPPDMPIANGKLPARLPYIPIANGKPTAKPAPPNIPIANGTPPAKPARA
jgi:hypothetical protein